MHFFHPIQQCAQQVYHTALPLSPTSSKLRKSCLQSVVDNQLSNVTAFLGASSTWGSLSRTINVRPKQPTCIATSGQRIITACEDIVYIYDVITGVAQQSLHAPETVAKIQASLDGSILFFAHSFSVTMWDVQTGGLIDTFTTQSKVNDIAVSTTGDHIAYGLSDGSVAFWNIHTKGEGNGFGNGEPVVTIYWFSPLELAVLTQCSLYIHNIAVGETSNSFLVHGWVWGMVYSLDEGGFFLGTSQPGMGTDQELCSFEIIRYRGCRLWGHQQWGPMHLGQLMQPVLVGNKILCITSSNGAQLFDIQSRSWINSSPLLGTATSVAVSLNVNLVVQTNDSIQVFSLDILTGSEAHNGVHPSHIYSLGEKHIACLQPNGHLTLLELETLRELRPGKQLLQLLMDRSASPRAAFGHGPVAWQSGTAPESTGTADEGAMLVGLSPGCTRIATIYGSPLWEIRVEDIEDRTIIATLPTDHYNFGTIRNVYDLIFDSEVRFYLKVDGPGLHVEIPHDIIASPSGCHSHIITKGEPVPLPEPRATPPYVLDTNCEWVVDTKSRKVCWIPPGNVRRGNSGHFWAGLSLIMVGYDGVVRKLTFKELGC